MMYLNSFIDIFYEESSRLEFFRLGKNSKTTVVHISYWNFYVKCKKKFACWNKNVEIYREKNVKLIFYCSVNFTQKKCKI